MPSKHTRATALKAAQANIRITHSSATIFTQPLTKNSTKRKRAQPPSCGASTVLPISSSNKHHAAAVDHAANDSPRSARRSRPSRTIVSEEEGESESEAVGSENESESDQHHSPDTSPAPNTDEVLERLDQEDHFGISNGESGMNKEDDTDDDSVGSQSSEHHELPDLTEITLHFRRGEKPIEDPITGKTRSPRKLLDWPSSKFIYQKGTGFHVFIGFINGAIDKLKEVKKPRYALLHWSVNNSPYIQPSHSSKQLKYPPLTPGDFEKKIARAYYTEKARLQESSARITVNVFVYLKDTNPNEGKTTVRPTRLGIEEANRRINEARRAGAMDLGQIEQTLHARGIASPTTLVDEPLAPLPSNALYNQARRLDRQPVDREAGAVGSQESRDTASVRLFSNGYWVPYSMDIADLRRALAFDLTIIGERTRGPAPPEVLPLTIDV